MSTVINWTTAPFTKGAFAARRFELEIIFQEPKNLFRLLRASREKSEYLKCHALIDQLKNTYIITAPLDMVIRYDRDKSWLSIDGIDQKLYDDNVLNRGTQFSENDPVLISCFPRYIFYSDSPVKMSVWPTPLLGEVENTRVVVGGFDISKWIRPIDWTFEIVDDKKEVVIKQGDPLFAVHFAASDDSAVVLNRVPFTEDIYNVSMGCSRVKSLIKNLPLKKCYELADSFLTVWRKYRSK